MSVTTKSHLAEDNYLEQQEDLDGVGDLGKDFGQQNHQDQAKADIRIGRVKTIGTREMIESKGEVQTKNEKVQGEAEKGPLQRN